MDSVSDRGVIRNRQFANQVKDYSGLRYGNMTPTDSDLELDYHNLAWIFGEFKYTSSQLPFGQRLDLERKCDDMSKVKPTFGFIASHGCGPDEDIDCANTTITEYRWAGKWHTPETVTTTKEMMDRFIKWVDKSKEAEW